MLFWTFLVASDSGTRYFDLWAEFYADGFDVFRYKNFWAKVEWDTVFFRKALFWFKTDAE